MKCDGCETGIGEGLYVSCGSCSGQWCTGCFLTEFPGAGEFDCPNDCHAESDFHQFVADLFKLAGLEGA